MRIVLMSLCGLVFAASIEAQDDQPSWVRALDEKRLRLEERALALRRMEDRSPDLWYGTPGVRPGGDLLVPIRDLLRNPSSLLDFRPRKVAGWLPDRETAECLPSLLK